MYAYIYTNALFCEAAKICHIALQYFLYEMVFLVEAIGQAVSNADPLLQLLHLSRYSSCKSL